MDKTTLNSFIVSFCWGPVIRVHEIADFAIIEYLDKHHDAKNTFHPVQILDDGSVRDFSRSYGGLEEAIVCALALKYDGLNSQAGGFFCKMIGLYDNQDK